MSDKQIKAGATVPTEEDVRAARFWLQVQEEARGLKISADQHLAMTYAGQAHGSYYKRGAMILVRYDLVLSPVYPMEDKKTAEAYRTLYKKVVTGPLIQFKKDHGKSGRFCGLVLRAAPNMGAAAPLPEEELAQWPVMEPWAYQEAVRIIRRGQQRGDIHLAALTKCELFAHRIIGAGLAQDVNQALSFDPWPYDPNIDFRGKALRTAQGPSAAAAAGRELRGGVSQLGSFYYYLTAGGRGRVYYMADIGS